MTYKIYKWIPEREHYSYVSYGSVTINGMNVHIVFNLNI